jgi:hypothetical protein
VAKPNRDGMSNHHVAAATASSAKPLTRRLTVALVVLVVAGLVAATSMTKVRATSYPADKVVASGSKLAKFSPGAAVDLMSATMRTSKPTDVILAVTLECSIITDTIITGGPNVSSESTTAKGQVRVWVEVDGQIVPVNSASAPPQNAPAAGDDSDKTTFCSRVFNRTVKDMENPADGIDYSEDYIETKDANSFNWLRLNMGSGVHTIVVKADLTHEATDPSTASAMVGNRTLVVIPAKMANDATI